MALNFADALDTKVEDIERPPLLPIGTYRWMVTKQPEIDTIADGRFDVCDFSLKCLGPTDDVDSSELQAFGDLSNVHRRFRFLFNKEDEASFKKTEFYLKQFLVDHLGIPEKGTMKELLANALNQSCLGTVRWRPDKTNPEIMYDEISRTAPLS